MALSKSPRGQSAIEVLLAVTLMAMMTLAAFVLFGTTLTEGQYADDQRVAEGLVTQGTEAVRQMRDRDFSLLTPGTHGLVLSGIDWIFSGSEDVTDGYYHRTVTITQVDVDQRDVEVEVTWTPRSGRTVSIDTVTRFANWRVALPNSSGCYSSPMSGDWTSPVTLGTGDLGPGNQGTDVVVKYPYAYMSGVAASANKPDLFVFDVSNSAAPTIVDTIDIGADGINTLAVSGNYLFAVSSNNSKELIVFDITNPTDVQTTTTLNLTGDEDGLTVIARESMVVIGRASSDTSLEVVFYDMTNPASPSVVAAFGVPDNVNDFATDSRYVYAVSKSEIQDITVYDAEDPINPTEAAIYDLPDGTDDLSIAYDPTTLFVGNAGNEFITIDASDPLNLQMLASVNAGGVVQDMACLTGNVLFTGTNNSTNEFSAFDISDVSNITGYSSLNFPQVASGVDIANGKVYVAVRSNDALRIIGPGP